MPAACHQSFVPFRRATVVDPYPIVFAFRFHPTLLARAVALRTLPVIRLASWCPQVRHWEAALLAAIVVDLHNPYS